MNVYQTFIKETSGAEGIRVRVRGTVFNATFNDILAITWRSVLLEEETGVRGEKPPTCRKSLTNFIT